MTLGGVEGQVKESVKEAQTIKRLARQGRAGWMGLGVVGEGGCVQRHYRHCTPLH